MSDTLRRLAVTVVVLCVLGIGREAVGSRPESSSEGAPRIGAPTSSQVAVTPQPPSVGGGTVEVTQALEAVATPTEEPTAIPFTATAKPTPVARLPPVIVTPEAPTPPAAPLEPPAGGVSLDAQVWAAVERYFPASEWATAMRVAWCESRYQPWATNGEHTGVFQVTARFHGAVPSDIDGQVRQAAGIVSREGWGPWSCR